MDLHVEVSGEGKPVVLVHSGGSDVREWMYAAPMLAKHYKVIAFDGRGCGKSPSPTEPANYVEDLRELFDHLQLEQATIIGHSIGGRIATDFALTYPSLVHKLVLIGSELSGYVPSEALAERMQETQAVFPNVDAMMEISLKACSYRVVMTTPERDLMEQMLKHNLSQMMKWGSWESVWPQPPAIERLHELAASTCYIIGKKDAADQQRIAEYFQAVPDIRFIEMEDADNMPMLTHPEELCRHITEFMEEEYSRATYPGRK
ncbi:alpha/beta fold hydrolase [Paenibacillus guangzhouensis]|uniref:alpha/beta fold hydrolase n=1 Tax=Paenibacillus guangzhouensis TaxID=1473112 RepID=UPI001266CCB5|nr:alpha/beta hydrolase [Paenibacillus guangzhouensis]